MHDEFTIYTGLLPSTIDGIDIYTNYENFNLIHLILSVRSKTTIGGTTHYMISGT